jgi:hypothetical protein
MNRDMNVFRKKMIEHKLVDHRDIRRVRFLTPGRHAHNKKIEDALGWGDPISSRMRECGTLDDHRNMRLCGVPQCSRCSMLRRGKEVKKAKEETYLGVPNERLAFVTILLPTCTELESAGKLMASEKLRLNNLLKRKRRKDSRWNGVHVTGFWEIDRIAENDISTLSERKQRALLELCGPMLVRKNATIWVPHLHAIVDLGGVSIDELRNALKGDGRRTAYQLHVQGFHRGKSVEKNLEQTIRYCMKFRLEADFKRGYGLDVLVTDSDAEDEPRERQWWPLEDIAAYVRWANNTKAGFRSLRFQIGRAGNARLVHEAAVKASVAVVKSKQKPAKAVQAKQAVEADEDYNLWLLAQDIDGSGAVEYPFADEGLQVGYVGVLGSRYKEPLQILTGFDPMSSGSTPNTQTEHRAV